MCKRDAAHGPEGERELEPEQGGFRGCYIHPRRPAIRNCINCERPICMLCEEESGDALLCLPCKEALEAEEASASTDPLKSAKFVAPPKRSAAMVGEVTILSDGTIVGPGGGRRTRGRSRNRITEDAVRKAEKRPPGKKSPKKPPECNATSTRGAHPAVKRPRSSEGRLSQRLQRWTVPGRQARPWDEAAARSRGRGRPIRERRTSASGASQGEETEPRAAAVRELHDRPCAQFAGFSLPYGSRRGQSRGVWLLFALIAKQWSQIAVFTLGIVVPWAFYKGSTMRKGRRRARLDKVTPAPRARDPVGGSRRGADRPGEEWLAYKVIYGANPAKFPFSDFMERYFKGLDWVLIVAGVALAFLIPFMLKSGEGWRKPAVRKPVEEVAEDEDREELEGDEPAGDDSEPPDPLANTFGLRGKKSRKSA